MKSSSCALLALVLALLLGGAYYFYTQKDQNKHSENTTQQTESSALEQSADSDSNVSVLEPQKIELTATSGDGHAVANRIYSGNQFIHTISAQLPDLKDSEYYAGWLEVGDNKDNYISTGNFEKNGDDYYLEFRDLKDLSSYNHVAISIENKPTEKPTTIVLEGSF